MAMTNAERQRKYRERLREMQDEQAAQIAASLDGIHPNRLTAKQVVDREAVINGAAPEAQFLGWTAVEWAAAPTELLELLNLNTISEMRRVKALATVIQACDRPARRKPWKRPSNPVISDAENGPGVRLRERQG